jgi:hypothetical protein
VGSDCLLRVFLGEAFIEVDRGEKGNTLSGHSMQSHPRRLCLYQASDCMALLRACWRSALQTWDLMIVDEFADSQSSRRGLRKDGREIYEKCLNAVPWR